jgi:hypothetical protein
MNYGYRAQIEQVRGLRVINARFTLRYHNYCLVFAKRINQVNGALPAYRQGENCMRE